MMRSLWTAASGMIGQQFNIDNISNNLSNVNTTGYKQSRADFEDLLYPMIIKAIAQLAAIEPKKIKEKSYKGTITGSIIKNINEAK